MKKIAKKMYELTVQFFESIVSLLSVLLFSRHGKPNLKSLKDTIQDRNTCSILGNGPSLKESIKNNKAQFVGNSSMVVNNFCNDPFFFEFKPRFYIVIDPGYYRNFEQNKDAILFVEKLKKIDWEICLIAPYEFKTCGAQEAINNPHIKYYYINITPVSGIRCISHFLYRYNLGMPRPQNVLNAAIFCAINMGFDTIRVYGADHSWSRDVGVYKNNKVCYVENHFYDKEKTYSEMPGFTISSFFLALSKAFDSHMKLRKYADSKGMKIINCTPESFIDAYERSEN